MDVEMREGEADVVSGGLLGSEAPARSDVDEDGTGVKVIEMWTSVTRTCVWMERRRSRLRTETKFQYIPTTRPHLTAHGHTNYHRTIHHTPGL